MLSALTLSYLKFKKKQSARRNGITWARSPGVSRIVFQAPSLPVHTPLFLSPQPFGTASGLGPGALSAWLHTLCPAERELPAELCAGLVASWPLVGARGREQEARKSQAGALSQLPSPFPAG